MRKWLFIGLLLLPLSLFIPKVNAQEPSIEIKNFDSRTDIRDTLVSYYNQGYHGVFNAYVSGIDIMNEFYDFDFIMYEVIQGEPSVIEITAIPNGSQQRTTIFRIGSEGGISGIGAESDYYEFTFYDPESIDFAYLEGWLAGYDEGILNDSYDLGYQNARSTYGAYDWETGTIMTARDWGNLRYNEGLNASSNDTTSMFGLITSGMFASVGTILSVELLPNITIGALALIPLVFGIIYFIVGKRKD